MNQPGDTEGKRTDDLGTYQMLWNCRFCGTEKLLGVTHRFCPNCGAAQDPAARYYPSDADKMAVENHVYVGADVICAACTTPNSASANHCRQCGAPLAGAARAATLEAQTRAEGVQFETSGARDIEQEEHDAEMRRIGIVKTPETGRVVGRRVLIALGVVAVLACVGIIAALLWTRDAVVTVVGHRWERAIEIESFAARAESAWCDTMAAGAYDIRRVQEQRSTRRIPDGEECTVRRVDQGDGSFREQRVCETRYREEPVYDDKCYYTINRWGFERTALAQGTDLSQEPHWPTTNVRAGACLGCEREGSRREEYLLILQNAQDSTRYECPLRQEVWRRVALNRQFSVQVGVITGQAQCDSLNVDERR